MGGIGEGREEWNGRKGDRTGGVRIKTVAAVAGAEEFHVWDELSGGTASKSQKAKKGIEDEAQQGAEGTEGLQPASKQASSQQEGRQGGGQGR